MKEQLSFRFTRNKKKGLRSHGLMKVRQLAKLWTKRWRKNWPRRRQNQHIRWNSIIRWPY